MITRHGEETLVNADHTRHHERLTHKRREPLRSRDKNFEDALRIHKVRNCIIIRIERVQLFYCSRFREEIQGASEKIRGAAKRDGSAHKTCVCNSERNDE